MLECDASGAGIGAVLMQKGRTLAYSSKALGPKHLGLPIYEKEMLAVLHAVKKWESYVIGRHFIIRTDHLALKFFAEGRAITPVQQKWVSKLVGFDYKIEYRPGESNKAVDALSRLHEP